MDQTALLDVLRRRVALVILLTLVTGISGYAASYLFPEKYDATALVLVRPQQPIKMGSDVGASEFLDLPMGGISAVETASRSYMQMIQSPAVVGKVVRKLDLQNQKDHRNPIVAQLTTWAQYALALVKYGRVIDEDPYTKAVKQVTGGLSLKAHLNTYLFDIKYSAKTPKLAADVANTAAEELVNIANKLTASESQHQLDYLKGALEQARQRLVSARQRLENYKHAHSIGIYKTDYDSKLKVIADLEIQVAKAAASLAGAQSTLSRTSLAAEREHLLQILAQRKAELGPYPELERDVEQMDEEVKNSVAAYEAVDKEFKRVEINQSGLTPEVGLVSPAVAPILPSAPRRGIIGLVALLSGLVVGIALAAFLEYLNRRVRSIHDVEDFVGVRVIATIPRIAPSRWRHAGLL